MNLMRVLPAVGLAVVYLLRTEAVAIWRPDGSKETALMTEVPASMPMMIFWVDIIAGISRHHRK
ncbi:hypothetical protein ACC687_39450, partial [Rhizobium ruizarguesonis]